MQRVASSTLDILMKPKPRERSDYSLVSMFQVVRSGFAYTLVVDNCNLFNTSKTTEFFVQVALDGTNT